MKSKIIAAVAAVVVIAALYFGFSNKPPKVSAFDEQRENLIDSLKYPNSEALLDMHADMLHAKGGSKTALLNQLSDEWLKLGQPSIASDYLRQIADNEPTFEHYMTAGNALAALIDYEQDDNMRVNVVYSARYCYETAMKMQPENLDAQIGLASVLVSGTNAPMEGIMMLRDIDAKNPGNVRVNLELGRFAVMSGQFDKALGRFESVLQKDSLNLQAQYMIAQTYLGMKDTTGAVAAFQKLKTITTDPMILEQVDNEINNLSK